MTAQIGPLDTVTVTVGLGTPPPTNNKPPVVSAGADVTISLPTYTTALTGTATDSDGYIVSYNWTKVSGPTSYQIINPNYASLLFQVLLLEPMSSG